MPCRISLNPVQHPQHTEVIHSSHSLLCSSLRSSEMETGMSYGNLREYSRCSFADTEAIKELPS